MKWEVSGAHMTPYLKILCLLFNKTVKYPRIHLDMDITQTAHPELTIKKELIPFAGGGVRSEGIPLKTHVFNFCF